MTIDPDALDEELLFLSTQDPLSLLHTKPLCSIALQASSLFPRGSLFSPSNTHPRKTVTPLSPLVQIDLISEPPSCHFETEGEPCLKTHRIGWINGIGTQFVQSQAHAKRLSQIAGQKIEGVYNATKTLPMDALEAIVLYEQGLSQPARLLQEKWIQFHQDNPDSPTAKYLQICHSQGAIHVKGALLGLPPAIRGRVLVFAIAPAAIIPKALCSDSIHFASRRDPIPYGEILAHAIFSPSRVLTDVRNLTQLTLLDPHPDAPPFDHAFDSPTFAQVIQEQIQTYLSERPGSMG